MQKFGKHFCKRPWLKFSNFLKYAQIEKSTQFNRRPCTRRARLGGRTALGRKRSYQNGWLPEEKKLKHNVVWENLLFVHILTFSVRFSTNDRNSEFSVLSTQLIGDALPWNWRSKSRKFADILIEHARLERVRVCVDYEKWGTEKKGMK